MPELGRRPAGPYEERIDFEKISRAQDRRQHDTLLELRGLLLRIERKTLAWVQKELIRTKRRASIPKYSMPLPRKYSEIMRRRFLSAHRRGRQDVTKEVGARKSPPMKAGDLSRVRAQADLLVKDHQARLETDLKREWSKAMEGVIDKTQLLYVTRKVFADFTGWEQPTP